MDYRSRHVSVNRRACLGGRGREWASESLKLLETMQELDDAKMFLEPMDPLKHQDYYSLIHDPIDLSKIMLKFHGGSYSSLAQFTHDMRLMFDNYRHYFTNESRPEYRQVRRLAAWYEDEITRITSKWCRQSDSASSNSPSPATKPLPDPDSFEARVQAIEALNNQIVGPPMFLAGGRRGGTREALRYACSTTVAKSSSTSQPRSRVIELRAPDNVTSSHIVGPVFPPNTVVSSRFAVRSAVPGCVRVAVPQTVTRPVILLQRSTSSVYNESSTVYGNTVVNSTNNNSVNGNVVYMQQAISTVPYSRPTCLIQSQSSSNIPAPSTTPIVVAPLVLGSKASTDQARNVTQLAPATSSKLALKMDVTNVWFGTARNRPSQPVLLSEDGFHLVLKIDDKDIPFEIHAEEIVRCAAYFGNLQKHTLFVFVVPNCTRRLRPHPVGNGADKFSEVSTLIVMFLPALSQTQIATMIYLFWRMRRLSPFNTELFSEVDQKGALSLLSNIKPTILSNVSERLINEQADHSGGLINQSSSGLINQSSNQRVPEILGTVISHQQSLGTIIQRQVDKNFSGCGGQSVELANGCKSEVRKRRRESREAEAVTTILPDGTVLKTEPVDEDSMPEPAGTDIARPFAQPATAVSLSHTVNPTPLPLSASTLSLIQSSDTSNELSSTSLTSLSYLSDITTTAQHETSSKRHGERKQHLKIKVMHGVTKRINSRTDVENDLDDKGMESRKKLKREEVVSDGKDKQGVTRIQIVHHSAEKLADNIGPLEASGFGYATDGIDNIGASETVSATSIASSAEAVTGNATDTDTDSTITANSVIPAISDTAISASSVISVTPAVCANPTIFVNPTMSASKPWYDKSSDTTKTDWIKEDKEELEGAGRLEDEIDNHGDFEKSENRDPHRDVRRPESTDRSGDDKRGLERDGRLEDLERELERAEQREFEIDEERELEIDEDRYLEREQDRELERDIETGLDKPEYSDLEKEADEQLDRDIDREEERDLEREEVIEEEGEDESGQFTVIRWYPDEQDLASEGEGEQELEVGDGDHVEVGLRENSQTTASISEEVREALNEMEEGDLEIDLQRDDQLNQIDEEVSEDVHRVGGGDVGNINIKCPITHQIMQHPVHNKLCGHCYDRQAVEDLISVSGDEARCPVADCTCDTPLTLRNILPDYHLWQYIQSQLASTTKK